VQQVVYFLLHGVYLCSGHIEKNMVKLEVPKLEMGLGIKLRFSNGCHRHDTHFQRRM